MNPSQTGPNAYQALPPLQNPQYPPQYPPQAQGARYLPPAQYGNIQAGTPKDFERQAVVRKMAEAEKGFEDWFFTLYQVWLWVLLFLSFGGLVWHFNIVVNFFFGPLRDDVIVIRIMVMALLLWIGAQSVIGLQALSQRNLKRANITCWMVAFGMIPTVLFEILMIISVINSSHSQSAGTVYLRFLAYVFPSQILLNIFISMVGAVRVKKILVNKELLQEELDAINCPPEA